MKNEIETENGIRYTNPRALTHDKTEARYFIKNLDLMSGVPGLMMNTIGTHLRVEIMKSESRSTMLDIKDKSFYIVH